MTNIKIDFGRVGMITKVKMLKFPRDIVERLYLNNLYIFPVHVSGSGRRSRYIDHTIQYRNALDSLGVDYVIKNTAPRGGALGTVIVMKPRKNSKLMRELNRQFYKNTNDTIKNILGEAHKMESN